MSNLTATEFATIAEIIQKRSGLMLTMDKIYLLETRLTPFARRRGMTDYKLLVRDVLANPNDAIVTEIIEAMMTSETYFFRDKTPFSSLDEDFLPKFRKQNVADKKLRIWCAACSTGQEPYSLAMMFKEKAAEWHGWSIEILATDISELPLARARAGVYTQFEIQRGLPINLLMKYFTQVEENWQISPEIISTIKFKKFNLLDSMSSLGCFDVIMCRNVLIYFNQAGKIKVLEALERQLSRNGTLVLGASEAIFGLLPTLQPSPDLRGFYMRSDVINSTTIAA